MTLKDIETALIRKVGAILSIKTNEVTPDALLHTLGLDSIGFVELLVFIEQEFDINLMESELTRDDFKNIRALANSISNLLG